MNFTYSTVICLDGKFGSRNLDGTWNGVIRQVMDENADLRWKERHCDDMN
jgi:hypothetical protein